MTEVKAEIVQEVVEKMSKVMQITCTYGDCIRTLESNQEKLMTLVQELLGVIKHVQAGNLDLHYRLSEIEVARVGEPQLDLN